MVCRPYRLAAIEDVLRETGMRSARAAVCAVS